MTDLTAFLGKITAQRGISGDEAPVAAVIADAFTPLCDTVTVDAMSNVIACMGNNGPRVMITAHLDEIGLMAFKVEDDGAIRLARAGGVDPRILPDSRVTVYTTDGPMLGIVGALPPHLLSAEDQKKNYQLEKLFVDIGLPAAHVRSIVHPGTQITLYGPLQTLQNNRFAGKTVDDRCGVAVMLRTAELLQKRELPAQIFFVSAAQEEVSSFGVEASAYTINPDIGIAIDVTFAEGPGCEGMDSVYPLDKVILTEGPNIHPGLHTRFMELARKNHIDVQTAICPAETGTDAAILQLVRAGVPTALVEIPLKYMHTTVETVSMDVLEESARLICAFIMELFAGWEELLCY